MNRRSSSGGWTIVYLGLGSNLGCRETNLSQAKEGLGGMSNGDPIAASDSSADNPPVSQNESRREIRLIRASSVYETEPWGFPSQEKFLNQVLEAETKISPVELLHAIKTLEKKMGREDGVRFGPRLIDIDILLYGDDKVDTPELQIPHPRLHQRAFVLIPMAELAPDLVHPVLGLSIGDLCLQVDGKSGVKHWVEAES